MCVCVCVWIRQYDGGRELCTSRTVESDGTVIINLKYEKIRDQTVFSFNERCCRSCNENRKMLISSQCKKLETACLQVSPN